MVIIMKTFVIFLCTLFIGSFSHAIFAAEKPTKYSPVYAAFVLPKGTTLVISHGNILKKLSYCEDYVVRMNGYTATRKDHTLAYFAYPPRLITTTMQNFAIEISDEPVVIANLFLDKDTHFVFSVAHFDGSKVIDSLIEKVIHQDSPKTAFGFFISSDDSTNIDCN